MFEFLDETWFDTTTAEFICCKIKKDKDNENILEALYWQHNKYFLHTKKTRENVVEKTEKQTIRLIDKKQAGQFYKSCC